MLSNMTDEELYKILKSRNEIKEKWNVAKNILLQRGIIAKNDNGDYYKELIEPQFISFVFNNLKDFSSEETKKELINMGLNKSSADRLLKYYLFWEENQKKKQLIWKILLPFLTAISLFLFCFLLYQIYQNEMKFSEFTIDFLVSVIAAIAIIPAYFFSKYKVSFYNFKKNNIFKVIKED
ncbi:MAG: hypothetical protein DRP35_11030 [Candidatus Zixiibacteriota bacterium]|nr:MAG: hypothetical protein DRP35_11030 [candidate division Zixibacteria bacterium]